MAKRITDRVILCWLDLETRNKTDNIDRKIEQLRGNVYAAHSFDEWNACIDYITSVDEQDIIYLVVQAEHLNDESLSLFDSISQLKSIFLLCNTNKNYDRERLKSCRKIILIQDNNNNLASTQIEQNIRKNVNQAIGFEIFRPQNDKNTDASLLNRLDASFMYSQLIKEMLVDAEVEYTEYYMDSFVDICLVENQGNQMQLENLRSFQNTYKQHSSVWWYTKESFLYSAVNKALRTQDVTMLFVMGFFIRDLHLQLIELQETDIENQSFSILYRGQGMTIKDFERLHQQIGGLISFNNFLSTSSDHDVSLMFARSARDNPLHVGIFFCIRPNATIMTYDKKSVSAFASLRNVSYYPDENEILFSMHTIFRIKNVHEIDERLWQIDLDFTNDQDEQLNILLEQLRSEIYVPGVFNVDKVGQLCLKMGDYDGALEVYNTLLPMFPDNFVFLCYIHNHLGLTYQHLNQLDQALIHYEKSIEIRRSLEDEDNKDQYSLVTYANLSTLYAKKGDLVRARLNCEHALALVTQTKHNEKVDPIIYSYHLSNLAFIQHAEGKLEDSIETYRKVITLRLEYLPSNHPELSVEYSNLAVVYSENKDDSSAIEYFHRALDIAEKSLPDNHDRLATIHFNIGLAYENLANYEEALKHINKAVDKARLSPTFDQEELNQRIQSMQEIQEKTSAH
ncbi:unnamed protein product [Rotaria magnacalcarata]|uniref:NAD(P)(+)--arginine ADP-ribosyltransferase n=1 Tax=Rotaria magnacalcarata TaxID=392030 RepID=A0A816PTM4_9BILA|nr:unnamed protein product [Rotaria magnacalcarata]CAF3842717.1 unnamed protein product [Rotaria magnacalcarata]